MPESPPSAARRPARLRPLYVRPVFGPMPLAVAAGFCVVLPLGIGVIVEEVSVRAWYAVRGLPTPWDEAER